MASIFDPADGVDPVITTNNPGIGFATHRPLPSAFGRLDASAGDNGLLIFPEDLNGNPAISVLARFNDGLPNALQNIGRYFGQQLLLETGRHPEQLRLWPIVDDSVSAHLTRGGGVLAHRQHPSPTQLTPNDAALPLPASHNRQPATTRSTSPHSSTLSQAALPSTQSRFPHSNYG